MKMPIITHAEASAPGVLNLTFDGKKHLSVDLNQDIAKLPALAPLMDWAVFSTAKADEYGHAVRFSDDLCDLGADDLWIDAHIQAGLAVPFEDFDAWRKRNGLSLTDIAAVLGITRRTATNYASGCHLIPKMVGLAMLGYETQQERKAA